MDVDIPGEIPERSHKELVEQYVDAWLDENLEEAVNKVIDKRIEEEKKRILENQMLRKDLFSEENHGTT